MLANQGVWIALLKETSAAKKRNTDLAFLIGGNDANMDEETRAWYDVHRQDILRPTSAPSSSASTSTPSASTTADADASPDNADAMPDDADATPDTDVLGYTVSARDALVGRKPVLGKR
jgi:hypothetical protein